MIKKTRNRLFICASQENLLNSFNTMFKGHFLEAEDGGKGRAVAFRGRENLWVVEEETLEYDAEIYSYVSHGILYSYATGLSAINESILKNPNITVIYLDSILSEEIISALVDFFSADINFYLIDMKTCRVLEQL